MPFSDSLARRITYRSFEAMDAATSIALARSSSAGTTSSTEPWWCSSSAVTVRHV